MNEPAFYLFTGLPCSGKTTLALRFQEHLRVRGIAACLLDGDLVRKGLSRDLGFTEGDRVENLRRMAEVGKLLLQSHVSCIAPLIAPLEAHRDMMRKIIGPRFIVVHVNCSLETCIQRDVKGHYKLAMQGDISDFTGISSPYETPNNPDSNITTDGTSIDACIYTLIKTLWTALEPAYPAVGISPAPAPQKRYPPAIIRVYLQPEEKEFDIPRPKTVLQLLNKLNIRMGTALVIRNGGLLTQDQPIRTGDHITIRTVTSSG